MIYPNVKKNFGFGFMRLPKIGDEIDMEQTTKMVDAFMAAGFNYFDTAHGYLDTLSEPTLRKTLVERYPRESFVLTNKLSDSFFEKEADIRPFFQMQLEACGVEYFDFYLMHAQDTKNFQKYKACRAYETALALKAEGKIRHVGLSFHDKASVLDRILTEYPQMEVVQLQFNYLDYDSASVEAKKCYEVCRRHGKGVIVMEPVKGGKLANLTEDAKKVFDSLGGGSPASYAIRFAAGFEGIFMVLSGMSSLEMVEENCGFMADFKPLNGEEMEAVNRVCDIIRGQNEIPCTACGYCLAGCPAEISIPNLFACYNSNKIYHDFNSAYYYSLHTNSGGKPQDCLECGKCEDICPQHLPIRSLLKTVAQEFIPRKKLLLRQGRPDDYENRLPKEQRAYDLLDGLQIAYTRVDHKAAMTMEDCQQIDKVMGVDMCKNLLLCNRQKTGFYLLLMPGNKPFQTKELSKQIGSARLSFADGAYMEEFLDITPGSLSVLGLANDKDHRVQLLIDKDVLDSELFGCHPCINTSSVCFSTEDLLNKLIPAMGHAPVTVDLP